MKPRTLLATILVGVLVLAMTGVAYAVTTNSYGRTYSGYNQGSDFSGCAACHDGTGAVGLINTADNAHNQMVTSILTSPTALVPASSTANWPSPTIGNGMRLNPSNVQLLLGGPGFTKEYVGYPGSLLPSSSYPYSGTATMPAGANDPGVTYVDPNTGVTTTTPQAPPGELPLMEGMSATGAGAWEAGGPVWTRNYYQQCGSCHNVGVAKPSLPASGTLALPVTGQVTTSITTSIAVESIECDFCHSTGNVGTTGQTTNNNHGTSGTSYVGYGTSTSIVAKRILQPEVCGQCHGTGVALAGTGVQFKRYDTGGTYSAPFGYNTNQSSLIGTSTSAAASIFEYTRLRTAVGFTPGSFYSTGANKAMNHGYFNEWLGNTDKSTTSALAPWDTTRTVGPVGQQTTLQGGRGHTNSWIRPKTGNSDAKCQRCHSGDGRMAYIGRVLDPTNGVNVVSRSSFVETNFAGTNATTTPIAGVTCQICHTAHSTTQNAADGGLGLRSGAGCPDCHNWQLGVMDQQTPSEAAIATGYAMPSRVSHPTRESVMGVGLLDISPMGEFMPEVECQQCHMPLTYSTRPSHRFLPMEPGTAVAEGVPAGGDSCTPCHTSLSRATLQAELDGWADEFSVENSAAAAALAAVRTRKSWSTSIQTTTSTDAEIAAYKVAWWNQGFANGEGSGGVHNPPYLGAGLNLATFYANAIGGSVSGAPTALIVRSGDKVGFFGTATNGAATVPVGMGEIVVQSADTTGGTWSNVATTTTDASGNYMATSGTLTAAKYFRAKWIVRGNAPELAYYSTPVQVTLGTGAGMVPGRLAGGSRYTTAVEAAKSEFATGTVQHIIIASGAGFPDALSAAGLAGAAGSPVLLVPPATTGGDNPANLAAVIAEINRLKTSVPTTPTLWVIGGTGSTTKPVVPAAVVSAVQAGTGISAGNTVRYAGGTRYGTSQQVAAAVHALVGGSFADTAFVVDGTTFPDALIVGPVAYKQKWPVILTPPTSTNADTDFAIDGNGIDTIYVVGSTSNVSASVFTHLSGLPGVLTATRITGATSAYDRSAAFGTWALANAPGTSVGYMGVASGASYPDGLGACAPIGANSGLLLLTDPTNFSTAPDAFVVAHKADISSVTIFGGTGAVSGTVWERLYNIFNP
jgi:hypothetical protein